MSKTVSNKDTIQELISELDSDKLLQLIRTAETSERYQDMATMLTKLIKLKSKDCKTLNEEERNLLSVGFKNIIGTKRNALRTLNSIDEDEIDTSLINEYKKIIESELELICNKILDILENYLIKDINGKNNEIEVFYKKMTADYYRYKAEFLPNEINKKNCEKYYSAAYEIAKNKLSETNPTRLGLALNFSVCYYEILKKPDNAIKLAKDAFDVAIAKLDELNDKNYKDSTLIMQLLRDNLTLWSSNDDENDVENNDDN